MKLLSKEPTTETGPTEIHILVFEIYHKTIGNGNRKSHITTSAYKIRCHPDNSKIVEMLLTRCFKDGFTSHMDFLRWQQTKRTDWFDPTRNCTCINHENIIPCSAGKFFRMYNLHTLIASLRILPVLSKICKFILPWLLRITKYRLFIIINPPFLQPLLDLRWPCTPGNC